MSRIARPLKRVAALLAASTLVAVGSVVVTAAPAPAAPTPAPAAAFCNHYSPGGVSFSVCIEQFDSTTARASINVTSGTYVSGELQLFKNGNHVSTGCVGMYHSGITCAYDRNLGSGPYYSRWKGNGGGTYGSPVWIVG